ncbi:MAG: glycosyltransferase family 39 protein [Candidatus Curtissbacteria bacterium]
MLKNNRILIAIVIIAAVLRFYGLGQNPPALNWDETGHGYNAYSLLKTGKDEYGYKFPLSIRSFDDYKPPLYTYLVVPSVAVFGLNDFAVRFPSALLGTLAVFFTYKMVFELLRNRQIALLAALFLTISPWHLQFSRVAFETNSAIFWSVLGTWALLKGINSKGKNITLWLSVTAVAFGANLYVYHNARVFIPLYSLAPLILFRDFLIRSRKYIVLPILIFSIFVIFLIPIIFSISGQLRYQGTTIFGDASAKFHASSLIAQDEQSGLGIVGKILHNRRVAYVPTLIDNYLSHFRPTFLFMTADMERHHAPGMGLLYLWDLPFILAGIYYLLKSRFLTSSKIIIFWWFLLSPVAAAVTWGVPHSLRSEIFLPTFQIFTAIGVYSIYTYTKKKKLFATVAVVTLLSNFLFYLHQYYVHMPYDFSKHWLYGRREAVAFTEETKGMYARVIVSTKLEQPHEFWLYYSKYDPVKYLKEGGTASGGFLETRNKFDKYFFMPIDYKKQKQETKTLFVFAPGDLPPGAKIIKQINYLNGEPAIFIGE